MTNCRYVFSKQMVQCLLLIFMGCAGGHQIAEEQPRIIFFGDSITQLGVQPNGFISLIADSLKCRGTEVQIVGAGISGNKVGDLQRRITRDVLEKKPTIVVIYIGINDVWHWILGHENFKGTTKEAFESGLKDIIASVRRANATPMLCTPSVIGEKYDGTNAQDSLLEEYSSISRRVASESRTPLCDLRAVFVRSLKTRNPANIEKGILTTDGVHLNDAGNRLVAEAMITTLDSLHLFRP